MTLPPGVAPGGGSPTRYETAPQSLPTSDVPPHIAAGATGRAMAPPPSAGPAAPLATFTRGAPRAASGKRKAATRDKPAARAGTPLPFATLGDEDDDEDDEEEAMQAPRGRGDPFSYLSPERQDDPPPTALAPLFDAPHVAGDDDGGTAMDADTAAPVVKKQRTSRRQNAAAEVGTTTTKKSAKSTRAGGAVADAAAALRTPAPPKGSSHAPSITPGTRVADSAAPPTRAKREAAADWSCARCTFLNSVTRGTCAMCNARRAKTPSDEVSPPLPAVDAAPVAAPVSAVFTSPAPGGQGEAAPDASALRGTAQRKRGQAAGAVAPTPVSPVAPRVEATAVKRARTANAQQQRGGGGAAADVGPAEAVAVHTADASGAHASWTAARKWVLTASGLDGPDKESLKKLAELAGCEYTKQWRDDVTHVVAAADKRQRAPRTVKLMFAVLRGKWVVSPAWVAACVAGNRPVEEAAYEIAGLIHNGSAIGPDGVPAVQRARVAKQAPPLFAGLRIHLSGEFGATGAGLLKPDLESLVTLGGGRALRHAPNPPDPGKAVDPTVRILCEGMPGAGAAHRGAQAAAVATGCEVLSSAWLLDCVAHGTLLPTRGYVIVKGAA